MIAQTGRRDETPFGGRKPASPVGQNAAYRPAEALVTQDNILRYFAIMRRIPLLTLALLLILACNLPADPPPPLTIETLRAQASASPSTPPTDLATGAATPGVFPADGPTGKIVYTCQVTGNQICLINADGTGFRQLTDAPVRHWYASISPDGASVVYSAYAKDNVFEIYELNLGSGIVTQLTSELGVLIAPEISPDGNSIVFTWGDAKGASQIWLMDRSGANLRKVHGQGWAHLVAGRHANPVCFEYGWREPVVRYEPRRLQPAACDRFRRPARPLGLVARRRVDGHVQRRSLAS